MTRERGLMLFEGAAAAVCSAAGGVGRGSSLFAWLSVWIPWTDHAPQTPSPGCDDALCST